MTRNAYIPYLILMRWLLLAGLIGFGVFMAWDTGLLPNMLANDNTRLSIIILTLFFLASLHCFDRSLFLSHQFKVLHAHANVESSPTTSGVSPVRDYLQHPSLRPSSTKNEQDISLLTEVLAEKIRGQHQMGWFATSALIKLGLLGTVIGFMLMLGSLDNIKSMDLEQVQVLMQSMTQGMKIALNTTLLGLGSSLLLGVQYLYLDRSADQLIAQTIQLSQQDIEPDKADVDVVDKVAS
ncbi:MAG: Unknown protein [uncultured Thiotrichaceae bacterium]|uniref:MotA/TolQ/ExbB proton channel domain-containing protein n=1 Tax=uncultured Thiotrichaceae bacterium TaxID=298394 RepID=A0A6S6SME3_9GAMM|nr:MAG: Unknown protein [uncultured Thiotrichaceae bacterium]